MSAEFWTGTTIGAVITFCLQLAVVWRSCQPNREQIAAQNAANKVVNDLLARRNEIGTQANLALTWIHDTLKRDKDIHLEVLQELRRFGQPKDPDVITCFADLKRAAYYKEAVTPTTPTPSFAKAKPAAFVLNMNATNVDDMIRRGLKVYRGKEASDG